MEDQPHDFHGRQQPPPASDERPQLLIIRPSALFLKFEPEFSAKFNLVKPYESTLPTQIFLQKYAQSTKATFCSAIAPITQDLLTHLPSLQIVLTAGTGVNHIDLAACRRRGIAVTNTADVFSQDVADYAVGLLIDLMRKISGGDRFVRRGLWPVAGEYPVGFSLKNKRAGIVGLGNIGSKVATRLEAFGCTISYTGRAKKPSVSYAFYPTACELASHSDILVICCSLTPKTWHMINHDVMEALGEKGLVVNIARGAVIDEKALVERVMGGGIGGAGLDVFENEPNVPPELVGLELDNVVLSPHWAAYTEEAFRDAFRLVMANLEAFFCNKPLISPVTHMDQS